MAQEKIKLRSGNLSEFWLNNLARLVERNFPEFSSCAIVDHYKKDGWNDGTTTLFGVFVKDDKYWLLKFPEYGKPVMCEVQPKIEHVGWIAT